MNSSRNRARHNHHRSELKRHRRATSSLGIEIPQSVVDNERDALGMQDLRSSSSNFSYLNSSNTPGQIPTPSGTSNSPLGSYFSGYRQTYGPLNPNSSQQSNSSSQGAYFENHDPHDSHLYAATQQLVPEAPQPLGYNSQFPCYGNPSNLYDYSPEDDLSSLQFFQSDPTVMDPHQSW